MTQNSDLASIMEENDKLHARIAELETPTDEMVEAACRKYYGNFWLDWNEGSKNSQRDATRKALEAALQARIKSPFAKSSENIQILFRGASPPAAEECANPAHPPFTQEILDLIKRMARDWAYADHRPGAAVGRTAIFNKVFGKEAEGR